MAPEKAEQQKKWITYYVLNHLNMIVKHYISLTNCLFVINNDEHVELMTVESQCWQRITIVAAAVKMIHMSNWSAYHCSSSQQCFT